MGPRRDELDRERQQMKVTVFGATGRIGGQVVRPALEVVAVPGLSDPEALRPALEGGDAAISGVGPRGRKDGPVASTATRGILAAMQASGVRRLVAVSAVPVGPVPDGESFVNRRILLPLISVFAREVYADLAAMEDEIRRSSTEWTVVRPPYLVNKPLTGRYRTVIGGNVPRAYSISRADAAHAMLAMLDDPATIKQAVGIAY